MKQILFIVALTIAASSICAGQGEQILMNIEHELTNALLKKDVSTFERYLADTYTFTDPGGGVTNKAQNIAGMKAGDFNFESSQIDSMKVQVYGNTAVVTYKTTDKGKIKEVDVSGQYRWTDVFVKTTHRYPYVCDYGCK